MIKLLTTHCPRCMILKKKLDIAKVEYREITDTEEIQSYGVSYVPALILPNETMDSDTPTILDFSAAIRWVNEYNGGSK